MDFDQIKDGLSWFGEKANEAIWGVIYQAASNFASEAFEFVVKYIVIETDPDELFQYSQYLNAMQAIALALLLVAISWEGVKYQSGSLGEEITLQTLIMRTGFAGVCIYFLPWSVENFFVRINNYLVNFITSVGVDITPGDNIFAALLAPRQLSQMIIIMLLIFSIALIGLSIVAGMRYIEIIILTLIAPLAAVSIVRGGELLDTWIRETIAIVFTQALQIFLLQVLANVIGKMNSAPLEMFIPAIGLTVIMIMGPNALRKFVYNTGAGSAGVKQIGSAGRMAVYKAISSGAVK
ncbi:MULTISPECIES: conjugal transfer protein TrbL family protein [Bacillaceae]|uniref:Conjugal transfer protein TrbL n=2 Tax=Bacillaceae TaxID=186817 RepID=A0A7V7UT30_9BACI|nr:MULTISPECIES: conjugal transfer protein TrbL family protein [Bacillaceae]KAB2329442.1 hypothetical protein F7732_21190 [Bacillus mesophilum]QVY63948.1 hypothetical protein J1899_22505 [Cytobacillus gottheilii]